MVLYGVLFRTVLYGALWAVGSAAVKCCGFPTKNLPITIKIIIILLLYYNIYYITIHTSYAIKQHEYFTAPG
jgi:hypothetical protein